MDDEDDLPVFDDEFWAEAYERAERIRRLLLSEVGEVQRERSFGFCRHRLN